ncbi:hypothetical protein B0H10DRAFT_2156901 [Mycena sp. CBHHK59/15]|nr:hypothetical protein B0H10DRAFT_2156901 [Mycena sp. CBHHK59/15]
MALQTETHSTTTSTPSSTSASAPEPTTTTDSGGSFSLSASPPLILAFLAVGMFGVAMIGIFGWRRLTGGRTVLWTPPEDVAQPRPGFGETPKLWDVWSPPGLLREADAPEWRNILPLAVSIWDEEPSPLPEKEDDAPRLYADDSPLADALAYLRRTYQPRRNHAGAMDEKTPPPPPPRLQIAVTIAMPSPNSSSALSRTSRTDEPLIDESPCILCISILRQNW